MTFHVKHIPAAAALHFGEEAAVGLSAYAEILASEGVKRGLIGPREVDRLWERHVLNCAVVAHAGEELVPEGSTVIDVGSGAGLPGLTWALVRQDISVVLLEPLLRRATFLTEAVEELGLQDRVTVVRARAEEKHGLEPAQVVTARAVAPLDRLASWTLPLTRVGGSVIALKGSTAGREIDEARVALTRFGAGEPSIHSCGDGICEIPTTVVRIPRVAHGDVGSMRETRKHPRGS